MAGECTILDRPVFTWEDVQRVANRFGKFELVKSLPSERDQNFLLRYLAKPDSPSDAGGGLDLVVLKVNNPSDELGFIECQTMALERAAAAGATCQRLLRTLDSGDIMVALPLTDRDGACQCRMLTYLPGSMLAEAAAAAAAADQGALFAEVGTAVGSVTAALLDMEHPAAHRTFNWDLCQCEEVISKYSSDVRGDRQPMLERFLAEYRRDVAPLLPRLRKSVVHNDPNDYNLVVDGAGRVGVLDFGDMLYSYTCADAAIGMAYLLFHCPAGVPLAESIAPFVRSFHEKCPLTEEEVQVLFGLAVMRVCTSVCMSAHQSRLEPDNEYLLISAGPAWALLERLAAAEGADEPPAVVLRRACGLPSTEGDPSLAAGDRSWCSIH
mmetsp:Transcript_82258/g.145753  ORF Transcript_82258/g.145753 Transcript_82258/m.145753 type:complete len:382 (-) Transcript_82258:36-1181(-)